MVKDTTMQGRVLQKKLMPLEYRDSKNCIHLHNYADIMVFEESSKGSKNGSLIALRFGGYPKSVQGMSDAIYGGGTVRLSAYDGEYELKAQPRQLRRQYSMNGIYAEAVMLPKDETEYERVDDTEEENAKKPQIKCRTCYIFCPKDDRDKLFCEIDKKTFVPLIPEFKDFLLKELISAEILKPLMVIGTDEFEAWVLKLDKDDASVATLMEKGLCNGSILIPNADESADAFDDVDSVSQYLKKFGISLAGRIKERFNPLFDPSCERISNELDEIDDYIFKSTGYSLFDAQKAVAETVKRRLESKRPALIVAECGSGKSKIGAAAMGAVHKAKCEGKTLDIIICPAHLTEKWAREIAETLPNTFAAIVRDISELNKVYAAYKEDSKNVVVIVSKERARDGYMRYPAVIRSKIKKAFVCPDCGAVIEMSVIDENGTRYMTIADGVYFLKENSKNHKCANCNTVLWAPLVSNEINKDWTKIGNFGFVYKPQFYLYKSRDAAVRERLSDIGRGEDVSVVGAYRRYPISSYIKKKMKGCFNTFIADELHEYNNDSGQGDAMAEIARSCKRFIGMTATLMNGYATGIFYMLYRIIPRFMKLDNKDYSSLNSFAQEYGVVEKTFEIKDGDYNANRRTQIHKKSERVKPGISPLIYSRFLLENAVFLSLMDMGKDLPEYEECPIRLSMSDKVRAEYERIKKAIQDIMKRNPKVAKKIQSSYMNLLTVYPDQPYDQNPIVNPLDGDVIVVPQNTADYKTLSEKDLKVLALVREKIKAGENVLIYTSWIRIDSQKKLCEMLENEGINCAVLSAKVKPEKRESWMYKQMERGARVLITNPSLVQTGLDLNMFTTLIYYNISYSLFTLRQASRRSWRINQTAPRIEVYFFYFANTMQESAMRLMAKKLSAASLIEGQVSDEGLAAMGECDDLTSQLARELALGLKDSGSEDIADIFKKMAILHPERKAHEISIASQDNISQKATPVLRAITPKATASINPKEIQQLSFFDMAV